MDNKWYKRLNIELKGLGDILDALDCIAGDMKDIEGEPEEIKTVIAHIEEGCDLIDKSFDKFLLAADYMEEYMEGRK